MSFTFSMFLHLCCGGFVVAKRFSDPCPSSLGFDSPQFLQCLQNTLKIFNHTLANENHFPIFWWRQILERMRLEKSNPDTAFFGAGCSISEPSESEWLRDTEAGEHGEISLLISILQSLDYTVYKTENTLLVRPFIVQAVILHSLTAESCNVRSYFCNTCYLPCCHSSECFVSAYKGLFKCFVSKFNH